MTDERKPHFSRKRRMTVVNGILGFVVVVVILQLWLLTATVNAVLGGDWAVVWPGFGVSMACFALNLGLLRYLYRME